MPRTKEDVLLNAVEANGEDGGGAEHCLRDCHVREDLLKVTAFVVGRGVGQVHTGPTAFKRTKVGVWVCVCVMYVCVMYVMYVLYVMYVCARVFHKVYPAYTPLGSLTVSINRTNERTLAGDNQLDRLESVAVGNGEGDRGVAGTGGNRSRGELKKARRADRKTVNHIEHVRHCEKEG